MTRNTAISKSNRLAVREYLAGGRPITELESVVLFGVTSLRGLISSLRKEGWVFESRLVPFATAIRRVNEYAELRPPENLPVRELQLTEWWVTH